VKDEAMWPRAHRDVLGRLAEIGLTDAAPETINGRAEVGLRAVSRRALRSSSS
jgi:hypothetical protein